MDRSESDGGLPGFIGGGSCALPPPFYAISPAGSPQLPELPPERIEFIGNSSVAGAKAVLLSHHMFEEVHRIRDSISYQELMVDPEYMEKFTSACFLPHTDSSRFPSVVERLRARTKAEG
ncbi:MAG: ASKHA domain-containing protein [Planctomycetota bacterium]